MSNLELDYAHKFSELRQIKEEMRKKDAEIRQLRAFLKAISERSDEQRHIEAQAEIERLQARVDSLEDSLSNSVNAEWHNEEIERLTRDLDVSKTSYEVLDERYWKSAAEKERMKSEIKLLSDALFDCEEHRIGEEGSQAEIDAYRAAFGAKE